MTAPEPHNPPLSRRAARLQRETAVERALSEHVPAVAASEHAPCRSCCARGSRSPRIRVGRSGSEPRVQTVPLPVIDLAGAPTSAAGSAVTAAEPTPAIFRPPPREAVRSRPQDPQPTRQVTPTRVGARARRPTAAETRRAEKTAQLMNPSASPARHARSTRVLRVGARRRPRRRGFLGHGLGRDRDGSRHRSAAVRHRGGPLHRTGRRRSPLRARRPAGRSHAAARAIDTRTDRRLSTRSRRSVRDTRLHERARGRRRCGRDRRGGRSRDVPDCGRRRVRAVRRPGRPRPHLGRAQQAASAGPVGLPAGVARDAARTSAASKAARCGRMLRPRSPRWSVQQRRREPARSRWRADSGRTRPR